MKTLLTSIFLIIILVGCQDTTNITDPLHSTNPMNLNKSYDRDDYGFDLIQLPTKSPEWQDSVFTVSKEIDGEDGGNVTLFKYYITESGWPFYIYATLDIPENAFQGTKIITMTLDEEFATIHFYPETQTNWYKPFILNQYFQGLDYVGLFSKYMIMTLEDFDFVYQNQNGQVETVKKDAFQFNRQLGLIKVQGANLTHFSRYGWIRKQG
ncbi:MAG: hypothetical protein KJN64_06775 [Ignavibacteria bacterium]|nr:hypothetical protein [Ignavibacteria bacterium]MBT8394567.1 hypothetical protein [Bacteroidia bacterium]NNJ51979.1 hypothetical protein [Ignavibacteriaceae bacterium]MBT8381286.1 hypothetical protein [Ignavibacteria bacterium]MBT8392636.1 hypothetical protein [Ignavibacteria bacterium]